MAACKNCLWHGQCQTVGECDDFTPVETDVEQMIEENRISFHEEWDRYTRESGN